MNPSHITTGNMIKSDRMNLSKNNLVNTVLAGVTLAVWEIITDNIFEYTRQKLHERN